MSLTTVHIITQSPQSVLDPYVTDCCSL